MKNFIFIILACFYLQTAYSTHNRAGEITYVQTGPLSITMTVTTYTKGSSTAADRDSLEIFWGDGTSAWVHRINGKGDPLENDVKRNFYVADHVYPGRGTYTISFLDPNRVGGIINLNFPRSEEIQFYLSTTFTLLDVQFQGKNNSAILLQPPIDVACVGEIYTHNPNAYDIDGDSLSYELITPLMGNNMPVPNYFFPDQIIPGSLNRVFLNQKTGDFLWESPPQAGEYNIAFKINEYRSGVLINTIIRDMQILVRVCNNDPPKIETIEELCVIAGTKISIPVKVTDVNGNQKIKLEASGGPLKLTLDAAVINDPGGFVNAPINATIEWNTTCNQISKQYYQIVLRALDNAFGDTFGLATLKTIRIKIVGPEPVITNAIPMETDKIRLEWQLPYGCQNTLNDYFYGFSVWRKEGSVNLTIDTCNLQSLAGEYTRVAFNTIANDGKVYFFNDSGLNPNTTYCYRVVAQFALKSSTGNPYNKVESIPSKEICLQIKRDIPLITKISVSVTSVTAGSIDIKWTKPLSTDFDTLQFLPPYKTELLRSERGLNNFTLINGSSKSFVSFSAWNDTTYLDDNINTLNQQYDYQLKFYYNSNIEYKNIPKSSSLFLNVNPGDKKNTLTYDAVTSWTNNMFNIYRSIEGSNYNLLTSTREKRFIDNNLENGKTYCYYVESTGQYNITNIENPIINLSQETCSQPVDNEAPCIQTLDVTTICEKGVISQDELYNILEWSQIDCQLEEIPSTYNIYYKPTLESDYTLVTNTPLNNLQHLPSENNISGCYAITALDEYGNESEKSNEICIENCPIYELPNTFTPNADGDNEVFLPLKNFFIASIDFEIFNEWGVKVFETHDAAIRWDGKSDSGKELADGTYYYVGTVYINTTNGLSQLKKLKGYINIIR